MVKARRSSWIVTGICAFVWLYVFPYYPAVNNPNENIRVYMTAAIAEQGTYQIDTIRARWGWTNDAACVDRLPDRTQACSGYRPPDGAERHYYSVKAPGLSLLGVPFYWMYLQFADQVERVEAVWLLRVFANILPLLFFIFLFHRWLLRRFRTEVAHLGALGVALGTCVLAYGYLFVSHSLSAATAFGAFALIDAQRRKDGGHGSAWLAGLLTAGTSLLEYPCFIVSVVLSLFALTMPRRRWLAFLFGALLPTLVMMHFQWSAFGSPWRPGHLFVETTAFRALHEQGFFGANRFHSEAAVRLLFDRRLGFISQSPWLALFPLGLVLWWRQRRRAAALTAWFAIVLLYLSVCFLENWDGGWVIGPRYLVVLYPFAAVLSLSALQRVNRTAAHGAFAGMMVVGIFAAGLPSMYYPHLAPEVDFPLPQIISPLIDMGLAPPNAGHRLGLRGNLSMLPIAAALVAAAALVLQPLSRLGRAKALAAGLVAFTIFIAPHWVGFEPKPLSLQFVSAHWFP